MDINNAEYLSAKQIRIKYGMSAISLRSQANAGKIQFIKSVGGKRFYKITSIFTNLPCDKITKLKYAYCRVSSAKQKDDLERQKAFIAEKYPDHTVISDIGSGINWKRLNFSKLLDEAINGKVEEIVIAHRDRLCRFSYELMEKIFKLCGTKLIVLNTGDKEGKSCEQELAEDLLSIIHIFNCKEMGRRRYKTTKKDT